MTNGWATTRTRRLLSCLVLLGLSLTAHASSPADPDTEQSRVRGYRRPPPAVEALLTAPRAPELALSPRADGLILARRERFTPLEALARPMLRVGARDVDRLSGAPRRLRYDQLLLVDLSTFTHRELDLPPGLRADLPSWSPLGERFAFYAPTASGVQLWIGSLAQGRAAPLPGIRLNAALGRPCSWMPDGVRLVCRLRVPATTAVDRDAGAGSGQGPSVMDSTRLTAGAQLAAPWMRGRAAANAGRALSLSQLALVDARSGEVQPLGGAEVIRDVQPSPDGRFLLVRRASATAVGLAGLALSDEHVEIWRLSGERLAGIAIDDRVVVGERSEGSSVWRERRNFSWVEALDQGPGPALVFGELDSARLAASTTVPLDGARRMAADGERLMLWPAPFRNPPRVLFEADGRITRIDRIAGRRSLYLQEYQPNARRKRAVLLTPSDTSKPSTAVDAEARTLWTAPAGVASAAQGRPLGRHLPASDAPLAQHANGI
ncbi:MAG: hypothetical protein KDK91_29570, partial [Gammaproteobacteria bacterium]|nr:hypothetical protein [Gammaproteobacteria bacterium]